MEEMDVYRRFDEVADAIWFLVDAWPSFAKWTLGKQLCDAADSVGFNLVEGDGRYSDSDAIHFFYIARGSARETKRGIAKACRRGLATESDTLPLVNEIDQGMTQLNALIGYRKRTRNAGAVRESVAPYGISEVLSEL
jgi:four helix bundle protein